MRMRTDRPARVGSGPDPLVGVVDEVVDLASSPRRARGTATILHIDDDETTRYLVSKILKSVGFRVMSAVTGEEGLRIAEGDPDLILLDVRLPDIDGFQVCRRLKASPTTSAIPVLLLSATVTAPEERAFGLDTGADCYLVHPIEPMELIATVHALLRTRRAEDALRSARDGLEERVRERTADLELSESILRRSEALKGAILEAALDAVVTVDHEGRVIEWNAAAVRIFGYPRDDVLGRPISELIVPPATKEAHRRAFSRFLDADEPRNPGRRVEVEGMRADGSTFPVELAIASIRTGDGPPMVTAYLRDITERVRAEAEIRSLNAQLERRLERLDALRRIDASIADGRDLGSTLGVVLDQAMEQLGLDAADILRIDDDLGVLEYSVGRGFRTQALRHTRLRPGQGLAGRAVERCEVVRVADLSSDPRSLARSPSLSAEGFVSYHAAPLIVKRRAVGVIEAFHRSPFEPDPEWLGFLEALAGQAAIAVDNASMIEGLRRSNAFLQAAYDATIEGWARVLDLRDEETEGHSRRVTEMTVELARAMGLDEDELVDVRRGALLHDIGKMGVPDAILRKPGALAESEWEVMRGHPRSAYEMLWPIEFLRPALDIPYCHHERWDGSGYPRGLRGDQIPLAARIFAAVDIFDALRSDRPYRRAWPVNEVIPYIASLAGSHLDPRVVELFLRAIGEAGGCDPPEPVVIAGALSASTEPSRAEFRPAPIPECEEARLKALRSYSILDTPPEPAFDDIALLAAHICGTPIATIAFVDADRQWFKARVGVDASETSRDVSFCAHAILGDELMVVPDARLDARFAANPLVTGDPRIRFYAGAPLVNPEGQALGTICVIDRVPRKIDPPHRRALEALAREVVAQLELRRHSDELAQALADRKVLKVRLEEQLRLAIELNERLQDQSEELKRTNALLAELATTDGLTGLKNRRHFQEALASAGSLAMRNRSPLSVIMLDVDHFKKFNDDHGHLAGDEVLRSMARILSENVREHDVVARFGGEEFIILLPSTEADGAGEAAERLRSAVADFRWPLHRVTVSLGVASTTGPDYEGARLIERADEALYASKRSGRNRVTHAGSARETPAASPD